MNAIQMRERINELLDRERGSRYEDFNYYNALNGATMLLIKDRIEPIKLERRYSVQATQRLRDELYTLIPAPNTTPASNGIVAYPSGYLYYLLLYITIGGTKYFCKPTTYNTIGPLINNPFSKPSATKPYFNELVTGLKIEAGDGDTTGAIEFYYIKTPDTISIGEERDKIEAGATLAAVEYYVYEDATHTDTITTGGGATVTTGQVIRAGETFTGTVALLLTGIVIPGTKITNSNLPVNLHEELCIKTAAMMAGDVGDYNKKQIYERDVERN